MTDNQSIELAAAASIDLSRLRQLDLDRLGQMLAASDRSESEHAALQGAILAIAKERLAHGEWTSWVDAHWSKSYRTARRYMRLAGKMATVAILPSGVKAADKALSAPKPKPEAQAELDPKVDDRQRFVAEFDRMWLLDEQWVRAYLRDRFQRPKPPPGVTSVSTTTLPPIEHSTDYWQANGRQAQPKPAGKSRDATVMRGRRTGL